MTTPRSLAYGLGLSCLLLLPGCGDDDSAPTAERQTNLPEPAFPAVSDSILAAGAGADWPTHGGNLWNHRYSPLDQITPATVAELVPVWVHSTGIEGAFESTPIVVGNTLYVTTPTGRVLALNAATGEELWSYEPEVGPVTLCCGPSNRGVSAYGGMVYTATPDAVLHALNARSGELVWRTELASAGAGYSTTMAPLAADGRVYVGVSGQHYGIRGFMAAFDAESGEEIWRWRTIPSAEEGGWWGEWTETDPFGTPLNRDIAAEREDSAGTSGSWNVGGGGIATTPAYDRENGRLYVNVESPAPLMGAGIRPGDNLYTGSIVALDARTGQRIWHAQYLPHDVWGLSGGSPPFLFDRGGERYVAFAGRTGWVYVFDAETGQPTLRSDNFVPQEALFRRPGAEEGVRVAPGANGGNPGTGVAYDPGSGTVYVGGVHQPMVYTSEAEPYSEGRLWLGGTARFAPGEAHWGTVTAVDLGSGEIRWQKRTPAPVHSDVLATDGGVVFVGQGNGTLDAFDARTGALLWQFQTGAGVHGGPVAYSVDGVQYIVVPAGGSFHFETPPGDDLIAFALASQRPARAVSDYDTPEYTRGGPASPGQGSVRQVDRETGEPLDHSAPPQTDTARGTATDTASDRPAGTAVDTTQAPADPGTR